MVDNLDPPKKGLWVFPYEVPYVYISMAIAWETTMVISGYLVASGSRNNKGIDKTFDSRGGAEHGPMGAPRGSASACNLGCQNQRWKWLHMNCVG